MRLDNQEKAALYKAIENIDDEVYLFGSRVDDKQKGGDIDLLIFSEENPFKLSQQISVDFFMECEEKIDVVVFNPMKLSKEQQSFLNIINRERIK